MGGGSTHFGGPKITQEMIDSWNHARDLGQTTAQKLEDNIAKLVDLELKLEKYALKSEMDKAKLDIKRNSDDIDWIKDQLKQLDFKIEKTCAPLSMVKSMQSTINRNLGEHDRRLAAVDNSILEIQRQLENMKNRNELAFKEIELKLTQIMGIAHKSGNKGNSGDGGNMAQNSQVLITNQKMLLNQRDAIDRLRKELDDLRSEYNKNKKIVNGALEDLNVNKADKTDLAALENALNMKLEDIVRQIMDIMPSKEELKKKFNTINNRLKFLE